MTLSEGQKETARKRAKEVDYVFIYSLVDFKSIHVFSYSQRMLPSTREALDSCFLLTKNKKENFQKYKLCLVLLFCFILFCFEKCLELNLKPGTCSYTTEPK